MSQKKLKFTADLLRQSGFKEGADGIWRKEDSPSANPPSRPDPEPAEKQQVRKKVVSTPAAAIRRCVAIVTVRTVRPRDYDGLGAASKHYLDALRHCGLFADDGPRHLEVFAHSEPVGSFSEEETLIEIYQLPDENSDTQPSRNNP